MMPFKSQIRARSFDEYKDWVRHDGEEFYSSYQVRLCFILSSMSPLY